MARLSTQPHACCLPKTSLWQISGVGGYSDLTCFAVVDCHRMVESTLMLSQLPVQYRPLGPLLSVYFRHSMQRRLARIDGGTHTLRIQTQLMHSKIVHVGADRFIVAP